MAPRSRCRRKSLTTHKSGCQPLFSRPVQIFTDARKIGCSKASEIVGPAVKLEATIQVDSCCSFPADPLLPCPAARPIAASRACPSQALAFSAPDEHTPQHAGRRQPASPSGP